MEKEKQISMMRRFLFGEAAQTAQRGASERLLRWCQAYDKWLAERKHNYGQSTTKQAVLAWRHVRRAAEEYPA